MFFFKKKARPIQYYDGLLSEAKCAEIIKLCENSKHWEEAKVVDLAATGGDLMRKTVRNGDNINLTYRGRSDPIMKRVDNIVFKVYSEALNKYKESFSHITCTQSTDYCMLRYFPGQYYKAHVDSEAGRSHCITCLLYLNTPEKGGYTNFPEWGVRVKPVPGRVLMFPSNYAFLHESEVLKKGIKYAVAGWFIE